MFTIFANYNKIFICGDIPHDIDVINNKIKPSQIEQVACGNEHCMILKYTGELWYLMTIHMDN